MKKSSLLGPFGALAGLVLLVAAGAAPAAPPANDTCSAAAVISAASLPYQVTLDTTGADNSTGDPTVPCVSPAPNKTVWFTFTPTISDSYRVETAGTTPADYEPIVSAYTGTCGNLVPVPTSCDRGQARIVMNAGTTYTFLVGGAPIYVDPGIRVFVNGVEACPGGAGPGGGGDCGSLFDVRVGDIVKVVAFNRRNDRAIPAGTFAWNLGQNASPPTATGDTVIYSYTAASPSGTTVTLTYTPPTGESITRTATMRVAAAGARLDPESLTLPRDFVPLQAAELAVLQSPGGVLKLLFERVPPSYPYGYIIPSVAKLVGAGGQPFVSDVTITNAETAEANYGLQLWTSSGKKLYGPFSIPAGGTKDFPDVVKTAFGLENTYGALLVQSMVRSMAGSRTYAPANGGGTNGQFATAVDVTTPNSAGLLSPGETGVFQAVRQDAAFRTNIGLFNVSGKACPVELEVRNAAGAKVGNTTEVTVESQQYLQKSVSDLAPGVDVSTATVTARNVTAGCLVGGVAYVIDRASEDPFAVPMRKKL